MKLLDKVKSFIYSFKEKFSVAVIEVAPMVEDVCGYVKKLRRAGAIVHHYVFAEEITDSDLAQEIMWLDAHYKRIFIFNRDEWVYFYLDKDLSGMKIALIGWDRGMVEWLCNRGAQVCSLSENTEHLYKYVKDADIILAPGRKAGLINEKNFEL